MKRDVALLVAGLVLALALAALSPLASERPDALEHVGKARGGSESEGSALMPGYELPWLTGPARKIAGGAVGTAAVLLVLLGGGRLLACRRAPTPTPPSRPTGATAT